MDIEGGIRQKGSHALVFPPSAQDLKATHTLITLTERLEEAEELTSTLKEEIKELRELKKELRGKA